MHSKGLFLNWLHYLLSANVWNIYLFSTLICPKWCTYFLREMVLLLETLQKPWSVSQPVRWGKESGENSVWAPMVSKTGVDGQTLRLVVTGQRAGAACRDTQSYVCMCLHTYCVCTYLLKPYHQVWILENKIRKPDIWFSSWHLFCRQEVPALRI